MCSPQRFNPYLARFNEGGFILECIIQLEGGVRKRSAAGRGGRHGKLARWLRDQRAEGEGRREDGGSGLGELGNKRRTPTHCTAVVLPVASRKTKQNKE